MALRCQDIQLSYEIIVVDSSPDETADIVRRDFPQVKLIHLPQKTGPELARNTGALHARGKIFAFIDSDCIAEPDWLCRLVARLEAECDAVGGAISNGNGGTLVSWAGYFCEFREFLPGGPPREVPYLSLGTVAYRRETFLEAGGFPPSYYPMEDQVFHWSLRKRGMRIVLDPQIVVAHMHRSERSQFLEHQRRIGRANAQVMHVLKLRGNMLARYPLLALVAMPLLILYRFTRTLIICLKVEDALVLRNPSLTWLCWLGMCWWARGFLDGTFAGLPPTILADSDIAEETNQQLCSPKNMS
jgi:GT2 family glycosyltransferase